MGWGCWGCFRPIRIVADSEYLMNDSFQQRMEAIDWSRYETAYGPAVRVPGQLWLLAKGDHKEAMAASHELWCELCHQHAYVSSAALPALPFLLEVMDGAGEQLAVEILDLLLGLRSAQIRRS